MRTQAVCVCAKAAQKYEGIGSALAHAGRSGRAAGTVCGCMGTFPCLSFAFAPLGTEGGQEGFERLGSLFFFFHRSHEYSVCFAARRPERE